MKIAHLCLSCFYIDGYSYQENELIRAHVRAGHEVIVIASTESYDENRNRAYLEPSSYVGAEGALVHRLPYSGFLPHAIMKKLRIHPGVYEHLEAFSPDVILFHGLCGWELMTVSKYKRNHPSVLVYVDSHEDANNSARGFISKNVLHKLFYKTIIDQSRNSLEKILCISLETIEFCKKIYNIPAANLEFFPLGGHVYENDEYISRRTRCRTNFGIDDELIVFLQTGKMGVEKKLTESLKAFSQTSDKSFRFLLAGSIDNSIKKEVHKLIDLDKRIKFLGWKNYDELQDLLCAADVYVQPGSQSATMQMSLCARCPVILDDVLSHRVFVKGNGWLVSDFNDLVKTFHNIEISPTELGVMSECSHKIASEMLDYQRLSLRVLGPTE